ncbi:MAG: glycosyltransferase family 9 protein [bacterium]|nr:glycosyltransferase family 9 protein [bacterium]
MIDKKKILFVNFGGLGDEILFLPTILSIKKQFPDSEITLALEKRSQGITSLTNVIDKVLYANIKGENKYIELIKLLFQIWKYRFDIVFSSGSNKFISLFLFLTFIPKRYGYDSGKLSQIFLTKAVKLNKNQYAVNMYQDLISFETEIKTDLPILNIEKRTVIPNTVLIHPGVSRLSMQKGMIKTVTPEIWAEVVEKLADSGKKVLLIGGTDDKECIEKIVKNVPFDKFENLYGTTKSLKDLAELISSAEKFLCSDSAPLHIAVALGVKTYVIFGSTDENKLIPQNGNVIPVKSKFSCPLQPCLWEKRQTTCNELICLKISSEEIVSKVVNN